MKVTKRTHHQIMPSSPFNPKYRGLTVKSQKEWRDLLTVEWNNINWHTVYSIQKDYQMRLVEEYRNNTNMAGVNRLQREILEDKNMRISAIKRVTTNKGGNTPGVDGVTWKEPWQRIEAIHSLGEWAKNLDGYKASPVLRVMIPKGDGSLRPLGIPTIFDRAAQCIYYYIIDPIVEDTSDYHSYGFRKHRSCHMAIHRLWEVLNKPVSSTWIYDADISKCFDRIDHKVLIELCIVFNKAPVEQWLKAGIFDPKTMRTKQMSKGICYDVKDNEIGTPQGGIISPILCNVALNGLEDALKIKGKGTLSEVRTNPNNKVWVVRYADDFIIVAPYKTILIERIAMTETFLKTRGLELSKEKSQITTIFKGFDFLGFTIRKHKHKYKKQLVQKLHPNYSETASSDGYVLLITPSKKKYDGFKMAIKTIYDRKRRTKKGKTAQFLALIAELNPMILGWRNYYSKFYTSLWSLHKLDKWITNNQLLPWLRKLERTRFNLGTWKVIKSKYIMSTEYWKWRIGVIEKKGKKKNQNKKVYVQRLYDPKTFSQNSELLKRPIPSTRKKAKGFGTDINPYTEAGADWWDKRATGVGYYSSDQTQYWSTYSTAMKKYSNRCGLCGIQLGQDGEVTELHRIKPGKEGGKYTINNVMTVHKYCHIKHHTLENRKKKKIKKSQRSKT